MSWLFGVDAFFESCAGVSSNDSHSGNTPREFDSSSSNSHDPVDTREWNIWGQRTDDGAKSESVDSGSSWW